MKKILLSIFTIVSIGAFAQNVNIPDANFKAYLVGNTAINTNGDSEIQVSEANAFTGTIDVDGQGPFGASDLTGISSFINLTELICPFNSINSLDLTTNTKLLRIVCDFNSLSSLDLSSCTLLEELSCSENALTSIDVSQNDSLISLGCGYNNITSVDVSSNLKLEELWCNNLAISDLDVSQNINLYKLNCQNTGLSTLNVANGNNSNFTTFNATNTPNLTCIEVDDATWSTANWTNVDAGASFSENCSGNASVEEGGLSQFSISPNPASAAITIQSEMEIQNVSIRNTLGQIVLETTDQTMDVSTFESGVYLITISTEQGVGTKRFIKN